MKSISAIISILLLLKVVDAVPNVEKQSIIRDETSRIENLRNDNPDVLRLVSLPAVISGNTGNPLVPSLEQILAELPSAVANNQRLVNALKDLYAKAAAAGWSFETIRKFSDAVKDLLEEVTRSVYATEYTTLPSFTSQATPTDSSFAVPTFERLLSQASLLLSQSGLPSDLAQNTTLINTAKNLYEKYEAAGWTSDTFIKFQIEILRIFQTAAGLIPIPPPSEHSGNHSFVLPTVEQILHGLPKSIARNETITSALKNFLKGFQDTEWTTEKLRDFQEKLAKLMLTIVPIKPGANNLLHQVSSLIGNELKHQNQEAIRGILTNAQVFLKNVSSNLDGELGRNNSSNDTTTAMKGQFLTLVKGWVENVKDRKEDRDFLPPKWGHSLSSDDRKTVKRLVAEQFVNISLSRVPMEPRNWKVVHKPEPNLPKKVKENLRNLEFNQSSPDRVSIEAVPAEGSANKTTVNTNFELNMYPQISLSLASVNDSSAKISFATRFLRVIEFNDSIPLNKSNSSVELNYLYGKWTDIDIQTVGNLTKLSTTYVSPLAPGFNFTLYTFISPDGVNNNASLAGLKYSILMSGFSYQYSGSKLALIQSIVSSTDSAKITEKGIEVYGSSAVLQWVPTVTVNKAGDTAPVTLVRAELSSDDLLSGETVEEIEEWAGVGDGMSRFVAFVFDAIQPAMIDWDPTVAIDSENADLSSPRALEDNNTQPSASTSSVLTSETTLSTSKTTTVSTGSASKTTSSPAATDGSLRQKVTPTNAALSKHPAILLVFATFFLIFIF